MEKKFYSTPVFSVEKFQMTEVICTSMKIGGGEFQEEVKPGDGTGSSTPRAKGREGIWDD